MNIMHVHLFIPFTQMLLNIKAVQWSDYVAGWNIFLNVLPCQHPRDVTQPTYSEWEGQTKALNQTVEV